MTAGDRAGNVSKEGWSRNDVGNDSEASGAPEAMLGIGEMGDSVDGECVAAVFGNNGHGAEFVR